LFGTQADGEGMASLTSGSGMCFKRITYKGWVNFGCLKWVSFQRRLTDLSISTILRELSLQKNWPASRSWYLIPWLSTIDKKSDGVNRESAEVTKWGFLEMY